MTSGLLMVVRAGKNPGYTDDPACCPRSSLVLAFRAPEQPGCCRTRKRRRSGPRRVRGRASPCRGFRYLRRPWPTVVRLAERAEKPSGVRWALSDITTEAAGSLRDARAALRSMVLPLAGVTCRRLARLASLYRGSSGDEAT